MQAMETERSPGLPSLMVTTRRRLMPHGTSCSFLQAVTQALHSMQRSASQRNFIRAMIVAPLSRSDLTEGGFGFLHSGDRIEAVGGEFIYAIAQHDRIGSLGIVAALIDALEPAGEVERTPGHALADAFGYQRLHLGLGVVLRAGDPDPAAVGDAAFGGIGRIDLDE